MAAAAAPNGNGAAALTFRWLNSVLLAVVGALLALLWSDLKTDVRDVRADVRTLDERVRSVEVAVGAAPPYHLPPEKK